MQQPGTDGSSTFTSFIGITIILMNKCRDKGRHYNTNLLMTLAINRGISVNANAGLNRHPINPRL